MLLSQVFVSIALGGAVSAIAGPFHTWQGRDEEDGIPDLSFDAAATEVTTIGDAIITMAGEIDEGGRFRPDAVASTAISSAEAVVASDKLASEAEAASKASAEQAQLTTNAVAGIVKAIESGATAGAQADAAAGAVVGIIGAVGTGTTDTPSETGCVVAVPAGETTAALCQPTKRK